MISTKRHSERKVRFTTLLWTTTQATVSGDVVKSDGDEGRKKN